MDGISCDALRKNNNFHAKLDAFVTLLTTQNEEEFCKAYRKATDYKKKKMPLGHYIWNLTEYGLTYYKNKEYKKKKEEANEKY